MTGKQAQVQAGPLQEFEGHRRPDDGLRSAKTRAVEIRFLNPADLCIDESMGTRVEIKFFRAG